MFGERTIELDLAKMGLTFKKAENVVKRGKMPHYPF